MVMVAALSQCSPFLPAFLWCHVNAHKGLSGILCWQALDDAENVMAPKVLEALLGTRFQGRDFLKSPLVCARSPARRLLESAPDYLPQTIGTSSDSLCASAGLWQQMYGGHRQ